VLGVLHGPVVLQAAEPGRQGQRDDSSGVVELGGSGKGLSQQNAPCERRGLRLVHCPFPPWRGGSWLQRSAGGWLWVQCWQGGMSQRCHSWAHGTT